MARVMEMLSRVGAEEKERKHVFLREGRGSRSCVGQDGLGHRKRAEEDEVALVVCLHTVEDIRAARGLLLGVAHDREARLLGKRLGLVLQHDRFTAR